MSSFEITGMASKGDGIGVDAAGTTHFIPGSVPGDEVWFEGTVAHVRPGPNRAVPACMHFGQCGGCTFQHVSPATYAAWLTSRILQALTPLGIAPQHIMPAHVSPAASRRRATFRYASTGGAPVLGFNMAGQHQLVDLRMCAVVTTDVWDLAQRLKAALPAVFKGPQALALAITATGHGCDLTVSGLPAPGLPGLGVGQIQKLVGLADQLKLARLGVDGPVGYETLALRHVPVVQLGGVPVELPPGAFLQATADGEAALTAAVLQATQRARSVADLFCGVGTFALPLAARASVLAVDAAQSAVGALARAAASANRPVTTRHQDLFRRPLRAAELNPFDAVVFDPPRAGAEQQTLELARSKVPTVVAVSCNPNTFARDAAVLVRGGYVLEQLWPVGQFLWSTHVELVAVFTRQK